MHVALLLWLQDLVSPWHISTLKSMMIDIRVLWILPGSHILCHISDYNLVLYIKKLAFLFLHFHILITYDTHCISASLSAILVQILRQTLLRIFLISFSTVFPQNSICVNSPTYRKRDSLQFRYRKRSVPAVAC